MSDRASSPPDPYVHAGGAMLLAGVLNVGAALVWLAGLVASCWGMVLCFVPLLLVVDGIFEAWTGWQMIRGVRVPGARRRAITSAVISFVTCLGLFGCLVEIYAIWCLSKPEVVDWLSEDGRRPPGGEGSLEDGRRPPGGEGSLEDGLTPEP